MTAILHLGILFLAKILDNALGTSKTILIQHGRSILAGAALAVSNYIGYRITKQIVTADSNMAMIAVSVASGFGCCLAMAINKKLSRDRLYVNILMSDNKEAMQDLRDYLAQHHITNVAADSYTLNWDTKTITVTAYAQTKVTICNVLGEGTMIVTFQGKTPQISPAAFVAETATLIGNVTIGADSSVWYGAVIRGDCSRITVGCGTSIQDNAVLHTEIGHPLTIGDNVTIGHGAIVHCASVGSNTLIGMGAILLDGAVIGDHCVIGAGAVVKEKTVVPSGTMMVGVPAKCVRELGPEQLALLDSTPPYVALSKAYLEGHSVLEQCSIDRQIRNMEK